MVTVAISGLHGAGKTTVAKALAKKFGLRYISAGEVFRQLAKERGMSLEEFSRYAEKHPEIDRQIDERTARMAKLGNVIIDGRIAAWMAENADLKILLTVPVEVRVRRIAKRERRSYRDVLKETVEREKSEAMRFKKFYGIDINDYSSFDIVFNTEHFSKGETLKLLELAVGFIVKKGKE